jgi:2-keto-4-pentenoate hydratase/2-oxohepta-3-ene-1,7-dioic acid hydratase in catechol pathway
LAGVSGPLVDSAAVTLLAPLPRPGKIICVGLNYADHCREQGIEAPAYPILFSKFANAVSDPGRPVVRPRATEKLDLECELAVVIGRRAKSVDREAALEHVFGYTILNDVTMRDLQREDGQWLRAKGSDGFAPMGPAVVTRDEVAEPQRLRLRSSVNGETWQDSTTAEMIFDVATLVAFISRTIALEPGDVIATGTPAGVGHFQDPPRYLQDGDLMRCEIEGIGAIENRVADERPRIDDHIAAAGLG